MFSLSIVEVHLKIEPIVHLEAVYFFIIVFLFSVTGFGVFATKTFEKGDYLITCRGELVNYLEGERRYDNLLTRKTPANFLYFLNLIVVK